MIERIGGEVDVGDSPMGGAQFRVRLPRMTAGCVESSPARSEEILAAHAGQVDVFAP
jgi:hypothetical protein